MKRDEGGGKKEGKGRERRWLRGNFHSRSQGDVRPVVELDQRNIRVVDLMHPNACVVLAKQLTNEVSEVNAHFGGVEEG